MCVYTHSNLAYQLRTGGELTQVRDSLTQDGLQQIFSTNLFGHFVMVHSVAHTHPSTQRGHTHTHTHSHCYTQLKELEGFLSVQARDCHVIWTSSSTASRVNFDPRDIQGKSRWVTQSDVCVSWSLMLNNVCAVEIHMPIQRGQLT